MPDIQLADILAFGFFCLAWLGYHTLVEGARAKHGGLNAMMDFYRLRWMDEMSHRETRIIDGAIMASLQNGTAFFASTSLLALGAAATLLRATDDVLKIFSDVPFGMVTNRTVWEIKVVGMGIIFGYAFFKFSWSYRLFNYSAILLGATPSAQDPDVVRRRRTAWRAAQMNIAAARHFSRGQRAFFFALGYMGWFISPWVLLASTSGILLVMSLRQFASDARAAVISLPPGEDVETPFTAGEVPADKTGG